MTEVGGRVRPPFEREVDGALVAGVAGGLARHLGVDPLKVRLAFGILTLFSGIGVLLYAAFWILVPEEGAKDVRPDASRPLGGERLQLPAIAALALGGVLVVRQAGLFPEDHLVLPVVVLGAGMAVVWRQADRSRRQELLAGEAGWGSALRVAGGVALLSLGVTTLLAANAGLSVAWDALLAVLVVIAGVVLTFLPWWLRLVRDLGAERRERIRTQERAELAAHLHDSVLQTLALIQRRAGSPEDVHRLARSQERELRSWLYGRAPDAAAGVAAAVETLAAEVESAHGVPVEVVTVGDCPVDDHLWALVRAAGEAMVNAAKFSGAPVVAVYVEADEREVTAFVRDAGRGFDPAAVPDDRRGIAESIVGRLDRHGGTAVVRSAPGEGTEVELRMDRAT